MYRNAVPNINLDTFDGDPTKWTDWNSRFQFMIGQAPQSSSQKIAYLQGLVKCRTKEVTQSFGCDGNYYENTIVELKRSFGRPTVIVGLMIQQLIQHLPPVPNRPDTYIKFSDAVKWQQILVKEKIEEPNLSTLSDWLQPIAEAYEQLEQQNVEHPATHQVLFVQNSKTTTAMYRQ